MGGRVGEREKSGEESTTKNKRKEQTTENKKTHQTKVWKEENNGMGRV